MDIRDRAGEWATSRPPVVPPSLNRVPVAIHVRPPSHMLGDPTPEHNVVAVVRHKYERVLYLPGQTYRMADASITTNVARGLVHPLGALAVDWWGAAGRVLEPASVAALGFPDGVEPVRTREPAPGALRIVAGCSYDPGNAAFRFHSALNRETHHASAFARWEHNNPFCDLRQYDSMADAGAIRQAIHEADVLHCHVDYLLVNNAGLQPRAGQLLVRHYHGSRMDGQSWPVLQRDVDDAKRAVLVGARLQLCAERTDRPLHWLPIPVPCDWYAALAAQHRLPGIPGVDRPLRIAHSPTVRRIKGTYDLVDAVKALRARGLAVELVLIERLDFSDALVRKASCDVTFDSFWLGLQGAGLEAAAMGQAVVAGDPVARDLHAQHVGHVPYTYANDRATLAAVIERLVAEPAWREREAARVGAFVREYHDYATVARRYEDILVAEGMPETIRTPERAAPPAPERHTPPAPDVPEADAPETPRRRKPRRQQPAQPEVR